MSATPPVPPEALGADAVPVVEPFLALCDLSADPATGVLHSVVAPNVTQGRGAWGAVSIGLVVRAAHAVTGPEMRVRHVALQILAPVPPGPLTATTEVLRAGSATATVEVRLVGREAGRDGAPTGPAGVLAHAAVVLGETRPGDHGADGAPWRALAAPDALTAGSQDVAVVPIGPPLAPELFCQLEVRPVSGFPLTAVPDGLTQAWVRPRAVIGSRDVRDLDVAVAALVDGMWPATLVRSAQQRPLATLSFALDLPGEVASEDLVDDKGRLVPLLHRGRLVAARDGYVTETRELWHPSGVLLAMNTQTVVVIR